MVTRWRISYKQSKKVGRSTMRIYSHECLCRLLYCAPAPTACKAAERVCKMSSSACNSRQKEYAPAPTACEAAKRVCKMSGSASPKKQKKSVAPAPTACKAAKRVCKMSSSAFSLVILFNFDIIRLGNDKSFRKKKGRKIKDRTKKTYARITKVESRNNREWDSAYRRYY